MGKYDYFLDEPICLGKSYRSYRKAAKKKRAPLMAARMAKAKREKAVRDTQPKVKYIPWPEDFM